MSPAGSVKGLATFLSCPTVSHRIVPFCSKKQAFVSFYNSLSTTPCAKWWPFYTSLSQYKANSVNFLLILPTILPQIFFLNTFHEHKNHLPDLSIMSNTGGLIRILLAAFQTYFNIKLSSGDSKPCESPQKSFSHYYKSIL